MSLITSTKVIQSVIDQYNLELKSIDTPDVLDQTISTSSSKIISQSPYLTQLKLNNINQDLPSLISNLQKFKASKHYNDINNQIKSLIITVDEKSFMNQRLIDQFISSYQEIIPNDNKATPNDITTDQLPLSNNDLSIDENETISELRKRLLSDNSYSKIDKSNIDGQNTVHDSLQDDILQDLTSLATTLKKSAISFSSKIVDDTRILLKTSENLYANESLMKSVGNNLNNYVTNKSGGKISFWFILKVMVSVFLLFIFMILLIKILPKM